MKQSPWVLFREEATYEEWERYHRWLQEQKEWRQHPDEYVVIVSGEQIPTRDVDTLKKSAWVRDNVLQYGFKDLTPTLGRTDHLVALFPSFFFTNLYQHGHEDPNWRDKFSYAGVASWAKELLRGIPVSEMKMLVFLYNEGYMHWKSVAIFMDLKVIQCFDSIRWEVAVASILRICTGGCTQQC